MQTTFCSNFILTCVNYIPFHIRMPFSIAGMGPIGPFTTAQFAVYVRTVNVWFVVFERGRERGHTDGVAPTLPHLIQGADEVTPSIPFSRRALSLSLSRSLSLSLSVVALNFMDFMLT